MVKRIPVAVVRRSARKPSTATKTHKRHKKEFECSLSNSFLCLLCLFAASFLLRGEFFLLFFVESFLIFLDPGFEIFRGFFEFVAVQQASTQCLEKSSRADVVGELFVSLLVGSFGH